MNILHLCPKSPFPPTEGGSMAMKAIRDGLVQSGHRVFTFSLSTPKCTVSEPVVASVPDFHYTFLNTGVYILPAFRDLLLNRSYHISRFRSRAVASKIEKLLRQVPFDAAIVESVFMMPYVETIRRFCKGPVILRAHNVEHLIWERIAANSPRFFKKQYLKILAAQLKKYELKNFALADAVAAISDIDARSIKQLQPKADVITIPFAMQPATAAIDRPAFSGTFGHIGSMDWQPNLEGIDWFLRHVWPAVKQSNPGFTFHLAGHKMPERFSDMQLDGLMVHKTIDQAATFMQSLDMLIVPLFSGSGVRIKIAEALSLGVPVLTTPVGAEGLMVEPDQDIMICSGAEDMIARMNSVAQNPACLTRLSQNGIQTIARYHAPALVTEKLEQLIHRKMKDHA